MSSVQTVTVDIDLFLNFVTERESLRLRKESGEPAPWTEDATLARYRFCNIRRKDDRVTRWLLREYYAKLPPDADYWFAAAIARHLNWPPVLKALLQDKMISQKIDYKLINASISGETSLGGLNRIQTTLTQHHPRILILALGANDGLRGLSVNEMSKNLESIIKACTNHHTQILFVGMQLPPNYGNAYTQKFHQQFIDLAKKYHLPFVPFLLEGFGQNPDWFQADGLHPSVKAQPKILDTLWPTLQPLLAQKK
jgi:acyl-CoA thioesterase-1